MFKRCPKSRRIVGIRFDSPAAKWLFPVGTLAAFIWFLVRVIPKPSRVVYPCQRIAASFIGGYAAYLVSILVFSQYVRLFRRQILRKKTPHIVLMGMMVLLLVTLSAVQKQDAFVPVLTSPEGANNPMGEGKGLFPGRVVWVQDFDATSWDGKRGEWWDDDNTNQAAVDKMLENALLKLTGKADVAQAWGALFRFQNPVGYVPGKKIAVKVNLNAIHNPTDHWHNQGYPSPHMVNALVRQLIDVAGVRGEDIMLADPSRFFVGPISDKIRSNPGEAYQQVSYIQKGKGDLPNHVKASADTSAGIYFNMPDGRIYKMCLASVFSEADFIINCALVRPHRVCASTSVAKNHFGSVWDYYDKDFRPNRLHAFAVWDYPTPNQHGDPHAGPVLLGHRLLGGKTVLYLADGLYTSINQTGRVKRFSTMGDDWFSSVLVSQDPVALESVVMDFIMSEPNLISRNPSFNGHQDSQLHEAALAGNPPSGVVYDPENDGSPLQSLGVHEHWNNPVDRQYSRNLGENEGIELVTVIK